MMLLCKLGDVCRIEKLEAATPPIFMEEANANGESVCLTTGRVCACV